MILTVVGSTASTFSIGSKFERSVQAVAASAGLSLLFLGVYGGCLWVTAQRSDIGLFYFIWERSIPFVPFMIVPYLSIDLFFIFAPFVFRTAADLKLFTLRVATAIVIAGICFLVLPLRFAFPRPQTDGWLGLAFDWFRGIDAPYNLFPSLHAALLALLVDAYGRNLRGFALVSVMIWFALIALSPILTHQHHVVDILGGFALAAACLATRFSKLCPMPN